MEPQVKWAHLVIQREVTVTDKVTDEAGSCVKYLWIEIQTFAGKSDAKKHLADYRCVTVLTDHDKAEIEKGLIYKRINIFIAILVSPGCK